MRGVETRIQEIRHAVFTEVAKMAYEEGPVDKKIEALPYKIIPGETGNFRNDVFLERAIVENDSEWQWVCHTEEPSQNYSTRCLMELWRQMSQKAAVLPPLINVIKFACSALWGKRKYM